MDAEPRSIDGRRVPGGGRLPDFLIIGAPRAGTTALFRALEAHPQVFVSRRKELNFFSARDFDESGIVGYSKHFAAAADGQIAGEASPVYMSSLEAPARMGAVVPDAKLIAILRHPVDRAWSHYWYRRLWRAEPRSFAEAVDDELEGNAPPGANYIAIGRYAEQLERIDMHFPTEALLVVVADHFRADPTSVYRSVCRHLAISDSGNPETLRTRVNSTQDVRSWQLAKRTARFRDMDGVVGSAARRLRAWNRIPFEQPPLERAIRKRLVDVFSDSNRALEGRLGVSLPGWYA